MLFPITIIIPSLQTITVTFFDSFSSWGKGLVRDTRYSSTSTSSEQCEVGATSVRCMYQSALMQRAFALLIPAPHLPSVHHLPRLLLLSHFILIHRNFISCVCHRYIPDGTDNPSAHQCLLTLASQDNPIPLSSPSSFSSSSSSSSLSPSSHTSITVLFLHQTADSSTSNAQYRSTSHSSASAFPPPFPLHSHYLLYHLHLTHPPSPHRTLIRQSALHRTSHATIRHHLHLHLHLPFSLPYLFTTRLLTQPSRRDHTNHSCNHHHIQQGDSTTPLTQQDCSLSHLTP